MQDPYRRSVDAEVAALESDIRHHVVDLELAFSMRDWALVARIYRAVAVLTDRLEDIDPDARSRAIERLEREQEAREAAYADDDPDDLADGGTFAGGAPTGLTANELLADELPVADEPSLAEGGWPFEDDDFSPWRPR